MLLLRPTLAGLLAATLGVPQQEPSREQEPTTFRTTVNVIIAPTVVVDRDGNYIEGLQPRDFRLSDNGKLQDIKVDVAYVPISLVVAVQANSHVEPVLGKIKQIAPLLQGLVVGEQGEVAIVAFDHQIKVLQDFTSDSAKIDAAIKQIKPGSSSSRLNDAVMEGARMLRKRPQNRRRVMLVISETRDGSSANKARDVLTEIQFDNISVHTVNINRAITTLLGKPEPPRPDPIPYYARPMPPGVPQTPSSAAQLSGNATNSANFIPAIVEIFKATKAIFVDNPVEVFTKWTGGKEYSFVTQKDLERAIQRIGEELHSEYLITYVPNNKDEGGYHEIAVAVPGRADARIRTRPGYWIASQPNP